MKTKEELPVCPAVTAVSLISGKWKLLILRNLKMRPWRFNELQRDLEGISKKVLTDSLRQMIDDGLACRHDYQEMPPRVEYGLTEPGQKMLPILNALGEFGSYCKSILPQRLGNHVAYRACFCDVPAKEKCRKALKVSAAGAEVCRTALDFDPDSYYNDEVRIGILRMEYTAAAQKPVLKGAFYGCTQTGNTGADDSLQHAGRDLCPHGPEAGDQRQYPGPALCTG